MATISIFSLIGIGIIFILSIVSLTQPWINSYISLFTVTVPQGTYSIAADCTIPALNSAGYSGSDCSYLKAVRATAVLGLLCTCFSGIYMIICLLIPQRMQRGVLGFVYLMVFSWFCNVLALGLFVGWMRSASSTFSWQAGFILLLIVIVLQMIVVLMLFGVVDVIRSQKPPENQPWQYQQQQPNGYGAIAQPPYVAPSYQPPNASYQAQPQMAYPPSQQQQPVMAYPPSGSYQSPYQVPPMAYPPYGYAPPPPQSIPPNVPAGAVPVPGGYFIPYASSSVPPSYPYPYPYPMPYAYPPPPQTPFQEPVKAMDQSQPQPQPQAPDMEQPLLQEPQAPAQEGV